MWSHYDEDLSQNDFFKEIKKNHRDILEKAAEEHWVICIPRKGSLKNEDIPITVILDHILVQADGEQYKTLSKKDVLLHGHSLKLNAGSIFISDVDILFEETHYLDKVSKYVVWCVNWPLFKLQTSSDIDYSRNNVSLLSIQDCIDFLYAEAFGHNLLNNIQQLCLDFKTQDCCFELETLQTQKEYVGNLLSRCLQLCFKNEIFQEKCNLSGTYFHNFKLSIETYMQYCLGRKLIHSTNTVNHISDCLLNKIIRNSSHVTLNDLNISNSFQDFISDAKYELSRINNYVTVLDKISCLSRIFNIFHNKALREPGHKTLFVTSDDYLQVLIYLILNCDIPNWCGNLTFIKEFQFISVGNSDHTNFLISGIEAAISFIKSNEFLKIKTASFAYKTNTKTAFHKLYKEFRERKNCDELDELLKKQKFKEKIKLCHPLCSCASCEKIRNNNHLNNEANKLLNDKEQSFLTVATLENNIDFVQYLLSLNYDINLKDISGKTALHYAAENGYQDILMLLISDKANVNLVDCNKNTALHLACDRGHDSCVKALIYSSHFVEINLQNSLGETPLFLATKWGYFDIIKILLENGAAVCFKNNRNLSIYKLSPNYYVSKLFEQFGNQKSKNLAKEVIDDKTSDSTSEKCYELPLSNKEGHRMQNFLFGTRAKNASEEKRIQLLLKAIEDNDMPLTSFYLGYTGNLVDKGDVSTDSSNITTKCHPLCTCNKCCAGDFLDSESVDHTSHKLNVNVSNDEGYTPLHVAAKFGRTDILRILLDGGAYLNVRTNKTFHTPLHLAVMFQRVQAVKELLNCGHCEIDAQDLRGNTPLYYACIQNNSNLKILEYLLKNGADCQKKNFEEKTVLQICEEKNLFRVCRLLKENMERLSPITKDCSLNHSFSTISFDDIDSDFEIL